jgi:hypothetical protein
MEADSDSFAPEEGHLADMELALELERELARANVAAQLFGGTAKPVQLGRFELLRVLGRGAMGAVYEARDCERGTSVALKLLSRVDAAGVYRLKREFRSLVAISHPNLIALDELFYERGFWFFSMELIEGGTPFDAWVRGAPVRERAARLRATLAQLATAVNTLHGQGKLHCDLKPSNVLVTAEARVVLLDFGLVTDAVSTDTLQTLLSGTPPYLAPERAQGGAASEASDWYAVGVMLYQTLTGRLPFEGNWLQVLKAKQAAPAPRARDLLDGYDPPEAEELCALCDALLARDATRRPRFEEVWAVVSSAVIQSPPSTVPPSSDHGAAATWLDRPASFVGRESELAAMRAALADVRAGAAVTVLLAGRSGVGKSALLDRFVSELDETTFVLRGRCHEHESVPYKVFDDVMDRLGRHLRRMPAAEVAPLVPRHAQSLQRLFPAFERVAAFTRRHSPPDTEHDARELRNVAFAALKELLLRLTDARPVVIVVDDLQWGDVDSARMLAHALSGPEPPPLLLLGAYRSDEVERSDFLSQVLGRHQRVGSHPRVVEVGPLPPAAAERLAGELLEREGVHGQAEVAACLAREAEGLAFFIGELVRHHITTARRESGQPVSLERAILERVAALPAAAQRLLEIVSVAGAPVEQSVALRAAGVTSEERSAVQALLVARLLRRHAGHATEAIETYHDRVRETVANQLDAEAVRAAHARIAAALESRQVSDPERLVMHHARAGDGARAAELAGEAAEAAVGKLAFNRAAELLRTAIDLSSDETKLRALQRRLGDALVNAGRGAEAAAAYLSAADASDPGTARELQRLAAMHYLRSGRTAQGRALARSVFDAVGLSLPGHGMRAVAAYVWQRGRLRLQGIDRKRPRAAASPAQLERLDCLLAVFPELSFTDPLPGAVLQAQFLSEALAAGEPQRLLQGLVFEVFNLSLLGGVRSRRARVALDFARRIALELGTPYARAMVNMAEASYHLWSGRAFRSALLPCERAQQGFAEVGTTSALERGLTAFMHFTALEFTGGLSELSAGGLRVLHEAEERDDRFVAMLMMLSVPYAYAMRDQAEEGLQLLLDQEARFPPGYSTFRHIWLIRMADTLNYLGRSGEALEVFARHWSSFLGSSHHRTAFGRDAVYTYRARCALISYLERKDPGMLELAQRDMGRLRRSGTMYRLTVDTTRAALAWEQGDHEGALRLVEQTLPRFRADDGESFYRYAQLAHARLSGDDRKRRELIALLHAEGVRDPERWAWMTVPIGPRPY